MTSLPTWAVYAIAFGTPLSAFAGVLISQYLSRRTAGELDRRGRREEMMRNLRWASELAVDKDDEARADLGVAQLVALLSSNELTGVERDYVMASLNVVYEDPVAMLERLGEESEVVYDLDDATSLEPSAYDDDSDTPERSSSHDE